MLVFLFSLPVSINPFYNTEKLGSYYPQYISCFVIPLCTRLNSHCYHPPWTPASPLPHRYSSVTPTCRSPSGNFQGPYPFLGHHVPHLHLSIPYQPATAVRHTSCLPHAAWTPMTNTRPSETCSVHSVTNRPCSPPSTTTPLCRDTLLARANSDNLHHSTRMSSSPIWASNSPCCASSQ